MPTYLTRIAPISFVALIAATPFLSGRLISPELSPVLIAGAGLLGFMAACVYTWFAFRSGSRIQRNSFVRAVLVSLLAPVTMFLLLVYPAAPSAHRFNDITTDFADSPAIVVGPNAGTPHPDHFIPWQTEAYPSIHPLDVEQSPKEMFEVCLKIATATTGWEVVVVDPKNGIIQAVVRTHLFRFEDDFVVRVSVRDGVTRVDARSKSRLGRGDRGANAARIEKFFATLKRQITQ